MIVAPIAQPDSSSGSSIDVLIVGAGPTGLALATQLQRFGASFRIVERLLDRTTESRALAVQARTLELLDSVGLAHTLVSLGRTGTHLVLHFGARTIAEAELGKGSATDTRYPFVLFLSQAETERVLAERLVSVGVHVERGVELVQFDERDTSVDCTLRDSAGHAERVRAKYLVGCDGAHSVVRKHAGFSFGGGTYPQDFLLGDVEADGPLTPGAVNAFPGKGGLAMFFPLGTPRTWRVIAMRTMGAAPLPAEERARNDVPNPALTLDELQQVVAVPTEGAVTVRDPAWLTNFRLHHRQTEHYRRGRTFLAGDAAHIHSPVGGQGMNTGIQDAWNLGWKLGLVTRGAAKEKLLDTYEAERWPVGHYLLRNTDRLFSTVTRVMSGGPLAAWVRDVAAPLIVPHVIGSEWLGDKAFRFASELDIRFRESPAAKEGSPRLTRGPRAGDRLPDGRVVVAGREAFLQEALGGDRFTLLMCARRDPDLQAVAEARSVTSRYGELILIRVLSTRASANEIMDPAGSMLDVLGVHDAAQYLIRPDGYVAFRSRGRDLHEVSTYLQEWLQAIS